MNSYELLLASLGAAKQHPHTPVQIQKLIFLVEQNVADRLGGPYFAFKPYDYGPFDAQLYDYLREMERKGIVISTATSGGWKSYALTDTGLHEAERISTTIDPYSLDYIQRASNFVRGLSFSDLVAAIYKAYPAMKENSVFRG